MSEVPLYAFTHARENKRAEGVLEASTMRTWGASEGGASLRTARTASVAITSRHPAGEKAHVGTRPADSLLTFCVTFRFPTLRRTRRVQRQGLD